MSAFNESPNVETNQKAEEAKKDGQEKTDRKPGISLLEMVVWSLGTFKMT